MFPSASWPKGVRPSALAMRLLVLLVLFVLPGLGHAYVITPEYQAAVSDAQTLTPAKISKDLVAVSQYNDNLNLVWEGVPGSSRVLMVCWTNGQYYRPYIGQAYTLDVFRNLWVTASPELANWLSGHLAEATVSRVEELLGLPQEYGQTDFVEMWVNLEDLFRPSADPEITDHEAELELRANPLIPYSTTVTITEKVGGVPVAYTFPDWYATRRATIYTATPPFPWTALGYTYDYGNPATTVGLSEFVIRGGSTVTVKSVTPNAEFLHPGSGSTAATGILLQNAD
ncbi:hypothetical protein G3N56_03865 [Desulfovibrio sulfodismutans]|uniref:Uncharacterized protein n=1 Tax=Desulfolutivibrio sulfodismutans TaxID=63561 RepID=A0A7K3NI65_9BACT|nr:hypothetical protein [Desulfolutivibrio sulfodismutans]NDY55878.1 hypothetical protein [Desulfolutivibrio sulfodismutans]QLA11145.1 hypothetical protein GD606_02075 [Desulfolutivibrio sulfodismutans DSM 3696]